MRSWVRVRVSLILTLTLAFHITVFLFQVYVLCDLVALKNDVTVFTGDRISMTM